MFTTRLTRRLTLTFVAVGVAAAGGLVGCSNGLVTSSEPGQAPSLDTPSATAPAGPSAEPTPSTPTTDPTPTTRPAEPSPAPTSSSDDREPRHSTDPPSRQGGGSSSSTEPSTTGSTGSSGGSTAGDTGGSGGGASGSSVASCTTADLDLGVERADGGGAAGSSYVVITYANTSDQPCSLRGYAGVSFVGHGDGTQLGAAAERVPGEVRTITLIPDDHDSELVQIANAGNFEDSECAPTTADGLRIYPPGSTEAAYVPFEFQACQGDGVQQLRVSPIGTSG